GFLWEAMDTNTGVVVDMNVRQVSADAVFDRGFLRGEYREMELGSTGINNYYVQGGVHHGAFSVNGQADFSDWETATPIGPLRYQAARDLAVGLSFSQSAHLVYKLEAHRTRGTNF